MMYVGVGAFVVGSLGAVLLVGAVEGLQRYRRRWRQPESPMKYSDRS